MRAAPLSSQPQVIAIDFTSIAVADAAAAGAAGSLRRAGATYPAPTMAAMTVSACLRQENRTA
jgi:hypothetical protein